MINSFRDRYFFLSNFYAADVFFDGLTYLNNESAFQAQKTNSQIAKYDFTILSPSEAKKLGRIITLRPDWEMVKYNIMYEICMAKFGMNKWVRNLLIATGDEYLEEDNNWGDKEWGTVNGEGQNKLGKILMRVRKEINEGNQIYCIR